MTQPLLLASGVVLVASGNAETATQIVEHLAAHLASVTATTPEEMSVDGFFEAQPDVLVCAFDDVQLSQEYIQRIRSDQRERPRIFQTIVLCRKEEVARAFELCKQNEFEDYVMYWPLSYEGSRLPMSVIIALRTVTTTRDLVAASDLSRGPAPAAASPDVAEPEPKRDGARNILVVEDNALVRDVIKEALRGIVHNVSFAKDGPSALAAVAKQRPDLVFMDVNLPGIDGIELTRRFTAAPGPEKITVIMMTGDATRATLAQSLSAGAEAFLVKPVTRNSLLMHVHKHLSAS